MARSVWKFKVPIGATPDQFHTVAMPARSEIVRIGSQGDDVFVWAIVDTAEREPEIRKLGVFPTGFDIDCAAPLYHGTADLYEGSVVAHVFEDMSALEETHEH